ncbi:MAG: cytochrome c oxidase assembly protein CtaG/Cox11 [Rhodocyclaceae bacterium]|nr:cytochrome c oxidase assembly protein CtaG/Cox11 [Rhodocyclaceae bacterium]
MTVETPPLPPSPASPSPRRLVVRLLLVVAASFAFGWAMVPFYDVLCKVTGLNGKTPGFQAGGVAAAEPPSAIDWTRTVTVEFTGTIMPGLPWDMRPLTTSLDLHPGELQQVKYLVRNTSDRPIVGQAIPSVSPGQAAQYFHKLDCFCFRQQTLAPGESREMPLTFIIKPEIDRDIRQITLSYAFYNTEEPRREAR